MYKTDPPSLRVLGKEEEKCHHHLTFMLSVLSLMSCQMHLTPSFYTKVVFRLYGVVSPRLTRYGCAGGGGECGGECGECCSLFFIIIILSWQTMNHTVH